MCGRRWGWRDSSWFIELSTGYIPSYLTTGHINLGFMFGKTEGAGLLFEHLVDEDMLLLGSPNQLSPVVGARWNRVQEVSFSELHRFPMILPSGIHSLRTVIDSYQASERVALNVIAEVNAIPQLIELAGAGIRYWSDDLALRCS
jgi:hypothetical protein